MLSALMDLELKNIKNTLKRHTAYMYIDLNTTDNIDNNKHYGSVMISVIRSRLKTFCPAETLYVQLINNRTELYTNNDV